MEGFFQQPPPDPNLFESSLVLFCDMRWLLWAILPPSLLAQASGTCASPFSAALAPGGEIVMNLRAGDVTIKGTDAPFVRVSCDVRERAAAVRISFAADHLTVRDGPNNDVHYRIEIPRQTNIVVRCSAGDLTISEITGDMDVKLNAGNLIIAIGDSSRYRHAEASVLAGNILASPFGEIRDGLFRSFTKDNPSGRYHLRAELLAGNLTIH